MQIRFSSLLDLALLGAAIVVSLGATSLASAQLDPDTAAAHFGQKPSVWGMALSPDGQRVSFLRQHKDDFPIAMVFDLRTGKPNLLLASDPKKKMDLKGCLWASDRRLLCRYYGLVPRQGEFYSSTRLVAVDPDGANIEVLAQRQQKGEWGASNQADVIDLLPDQEDYILMPEMKDYGQGVSRVDIVKNKLKTIIKPRRTVWGYWSDGRGNVRIRRDRDRTKDEYQVRLAGETRWRLLHTSRPEDLDDLYDVWGFGESPNQLLVRDGLDGRVALFREFLDEGKPEDRKRELIYAHPEVDLLGPIVTQSGGYDRIVGVSYITDRIHTHYFDPEVKDRVDRIQEQLPGMEIRVLGSSRDGRYHLIQASSDIESGAFHRFDDETGTLDMIVESHPWLADEPMSPMRFVKYPSDDGVKIPGYLTQHPSHRGKRSPAVILPHGGRVARDTWGYNWLVQFFASQGYVVLQPQYRGSFGYGLAWRGEGVFKGWRRAITDIDHGLDYLIEQGIVDADRVCTIGWGFGGYAALMSAVELPERYRCVVSIAGVTDPATLSRDYTGPQAHRFKNVFFGRSKEVIQLGSPKKRAQEIRVPVLLAHGERDVNVPFEHSEILHKALGKADVPVEFVVYEDDDHHMHKQRNQIDLFQRVGAFVEKHTQPRKEAPAVEQ